MFELYNIGNFGFLHIINKCLIGTFQCKHKAYRKVFITSVLSLSFKKYKCFTEYLRMKRIIVILALVFATYYAQSQVLISLLLGDKLNSPNLEFGLEGGFNYTNINGFEESELLRNFNLGFYFDIRMKENLFLYTGVQVKSNFGMENLTENDLKFLEAHIETIKGDYSQKISAFMVPILAKYKFKNHMYIEAGPQMGLVYKGWVEFTSDIDGRDVESKDYNDELLNWFNGGFALGTGYQLMKGEGWTVGVRYYQGLTDVFKDRSGTKHHSFHIKVNVPIGAAAAKEKG